MVRNNQAGCYSALMQANPNTTAPYDALSPDTILDAIESIGIEKVRAGQAELAQRTGIAAYQPLPF